MDVLRDVDPTDIFECLRLTRALSIKTEYEWVNAVLHILNIKISFRFAWFSYWPMKTGLTGVLQLYSLSVTHFPIALERAHQLQLNLAEEQRLKDNYIFLSIIKTSPATLKFMSSAVKRLTYEFYMPSAAVLCAVAAWSVCAWFG